MSLECTQCFVYERDAQQIPKEDLVCKVGDFNTTPCSPRFNEICDMLHENMAMFRDIVILPDNTY